MNLSLNRGFDLIPREWVSNLTDTMIKQLSIWLALMLGVCTMCGCTTFSSSVMPSWRESFGHRKIENPWDSEKYRDPKGYAFHQARWAPMVSDSDYRSQELDAQMIANSPPIAGRRDLKLLPEVENPDQTRSPASLVADVRAVSHQSRR